MTLRTVVPLYRLEMGCLVIRLQSLLHIHVHPHLTVLVQVLSRETLLGCKDLRSIQLSGPENIRVHGVI